MQILHGMMVGPSPYAAITLQKPRCHFGGFCFCRAVGRERRRRFSSAFSPGPSSRPRERRRTGSARRKYYPDPRQQCRNTACTANKVCDPFTQWLHSDIP